MLEKKKALRKIIKVRVSAISANERQKREEILHNNLFSMPEFLSAESVMLFANLPDEIDTFSLIDKCFAMGKKVYLPVINGDDMIVAEFTGEFKEGRFGIKEPVIDTTLPTLTPNSIDFALVPGVGFSPSGYRLGRGKGYYDKFLSKYSNLYTVGICFREQFYLDIPTEPHDIPMNKVLVI